MYEYLRIPYAEAPAKEYGWAAPRHPKNWTGTKEKKEFGAACPQPDFNIPNFKREKRNGKMNKVFFSIRMSLEVCQGSSQRPLLCIHKFNKLCCKNTHLEARETRKFS